MWAGHWLSKRNLNNSNMLVSCGRGMSVSRAPLEPVSLSTHWKRELFISLFIIMASNIGPSLMTNSIIRWMICSSSRSVGITTFTNDRNSICGGARTILRLLTSFSSNAPAQNSPPLPLLVRDQLREAAQSHTWNRNRNWASSEAGH